MEPKLIRTFMTTGSDGVRRKLREWQSYHSIRGDPHDPHVQWVSDMYPSLTTKDGEEVYCRNEEDGLFEIVGCSWYATRDNPKAEPRLPTPNRSAPN